MMSSDNKFEANVEQIYRASFEAMGRLYTVTGEITDRNQMTNIVVEAYPTGAAHEVIRFRSISELLEFASLMDKTVASMDAKLFDVRRR